MMARLRDVKRVYGVQGKGVSGAISRRRRKRGAFLAGQSPAARAAFNL
jgi:hypothetical protein